MHLIYPKVSLNLGTVTAFQDTRSIDDFCSSLTIFKCNPVGDLGNSPFNNFLCDAIAGVDKNNLKIPSCSDRY